MSDITTILEGARTLLGDVPREGLGREKLSRWRAPRIVRAGSAWHIGVLLIGDTDVYSTAEVLRAADPGRRGYTAESARERAERRAWALRGGFSEGEVVHIGWEAIDLDAVGRGEASGPLALIDGVPSVRWSPAGGYAPLENYLRERIELMRGNVG